MYYVYILQEKGGKYYIGCTDNIERRIKEHNSGYSKFTKAYKFWVLKYSEKYKSLKEARERERQIKKWKKRIAIERLIDTGPVV